MTFLPAWNQYLWPLMVVQTESLRPAMVGIDYFKQAFQRSFINSIASSGVKG